MKVKINVFHDCAYLLGVEIITMNIAKTILTVLIAT